MFQPGELMVYGTTGVCRVEEVTRLPGGDRKRQYYLLRPLWQEALAQQYQAAFREGSHQDLIGMMKAIYLKRGQAEAKNRRLGVVDERYMKQAERLLYGELAIALGLPYNEVEDYITSRLDRAEDSAGA